MWRHKIRTGNPRAAATWRRSSGSRSDTGCVAMESFANEAVMLTRMSSATSEHIL
jgi:hypothetical protein